MRSHTDKILAMSFDLTHRYLATVSADQSIRVWDLDTLAQLFDFQAPGELPCAIAYHPRQQCFACGFMSGCVRVFHVGTTNLLAEHNQHAGQVTGLVFTPNGEFLHTVFIELINEYRMDFHLEGSEEAVPCKISKACHRKICSRSVASS